MPDRTEANPNELNQDDARYGFRCCHLKNIWTAPLPPETELSRQMTTSTTSSDIMGLQAAYANLHTDQERDYFMQRYHDVISSCGSKTSYDADNRPLLVMRSNLWSSGYDVDGTDKPSSGHISRSVSQTHRHDLPLYGRSRRQRLLVHQFVVLKLWQRHRRAGKRGALTEPRQRFSHD